MGRGTTLQLQPESTTKLMVVGTRKTCIPDTSETLVVVHPKIEYKINKSEYNLYLNTREQVEVFLNPAKKYTYDWSPS
ncbi:MAG: hypothetical protein WAT46_08040 [Saprospiraceae bacterium]